MSELDTLRALSRLLDEAQTLSEELPHDTPALERAAHALDAAAEGYHGALMHREREWFSGRLHPERPWRPRVAP